MAELKNVERIEQDVHETTWFERFRSNSQQFGVGAAVVGTALVGTSTANAAEGTGIAATILTAVTDEVTAVLNSQKAIYGLLVVVLVGFLIWRYSKRTVNSG
ncbi:hypothetical protein [Acinetobacter sp. SEK570]|uniref:hypothetical protein n=1 Tax=unclassified Acinetobacter TaxID=196816 RepID=UPI0039A15AFE